MIVFPFILTLLSILSIFYNPFIRPVGALDVSLPYNFFLEIKVFDEIGRGDYVEIYVGDVEVPHKGKKKPKYLIKKVACLEGDFLELKGTRYFCNGELITELYPFAPFKPFSFTGEIPKNKYFVIGIHPRSYDSRYMGLIDRERIVAKMIPLF